MMTVIMGGISCVGTADCSCCYRSSPVKSINCKPLVLRIGHEGISSILLNLFFSVIGELVYGGKVRIINYELIRE